MRKAVAVACADWHIQSKAPVCRSGDKDWMLTQFAYLKQVEMIARANGPEFAPLPIIVAGDVFHKHNPPAELLNFFLTHSPKIYAVPGNHDLMNHRLSDMEKSGYWNCYLGGKIHNLDPDFPTLLSEGNSIRAWAFPWGMEPKPCPNPHDLHMEIAVVHKFMYLDERTSYEGAPEEGRLTNKTAKQFAGYDVVVIGDNHIPWTSKVGNTQFINCGSLMRTTTAQRNYKPAVWIVYDDGSVEPKYLDISQDVFNDSHLQRGNGKSVQVGQLADYLKNIRQQPADFDEAVKRVIRDKSIKASVRDTLQELLDGSQ